MNALFETMGIQAIESEIFRQCAAVSAQLSDQCLSFGRRGFLRVSTPDHLDFDVVPLFEFECFNHWRR
jgi:hypothetical protein